MALFISTPSVRPPAFCQPLLVLRGPSALPRVHGVMPQVAVAHDERERLRWVQRPATEETGPGVFIPEHRAATTGAGGQQDGTHVYTVTSPLVVVVVTVPVAVIQVPARRPRRQPQLMQRHHLRKPGRHQT